MSLSPWIITLFNTCFWVGVGSQMSVDIPPLRASELIIPVSNRFLSSMRPFKRPPYCLGSGHFKIFGTTDTAEILATVPIVAGPKFSKCTEPSHDGGYFEANNITNQLIRSAPVTTRSISPFQVMQKLADVPDDGETFREGPLDINGRLTTRLVWKSFEADINQRIEGEWMWVPLKVLSAYGQIVSGMQYDLKVLAGTSNCSRYQVNAYTIQEQKCVHFNGPKRAIFNILVMERSSKSWSPFIPDWERVFSTVDREIGDNEDI